MIELRDESVLAILDGRKTVTRRLGRRWSRLQAGDRLWGREAHVIVDGPCWSGLPMRSAEVLVDPADETGPTRTVWAYFRAGFDRTAPSPWRPARYMPRWASRIDLEVTSAIQVRLGELDDTEAALEGFASAEAFHVAFRGMHPTLTLDDLVWRIAFRRTG